MKHKNPNNNIPKIMFWRKSHHACILDRIIMTTVDLLYIFIFCYFVCIINIRRTRSRLLMSLCNLHFRLVHISFFGIQQGNLIYVTLLISISVLCIRTHQTHFLLRYHYRADNVHVYENKNLDKTEMTDPKL